MPLCWQCCSFLEVLWWNFFRSLMYNITPANGNNFPTWIHFVFFLFSLVLQLGFKYYIEKKLVPNPVLFFLFIQMGLLPVFFHLWWCWFSVCQDSLYYVEICFLQSYSLLAKTFTMKAFWILPKALYSIFWDGHVIFVYKSIYMVFGIY